MAGKYSEALRAASMSAVSGVFDGFYEQKTIFLKLFLLGIVGAIFKNLAAGFFEAGIAGTGNYIIQLSLMAVLTSGMYWAAGVARNVLDSIVEFMQVLIPTYAVVITAGCRKLGCNSILRTCHVPYTDCGQGAAACGSARNNSIYACKYDELYIER